MQQPKTETPSDALVYRRAFTAALVGLLIQVILILAMGLAALWSNGQALYAASWHMLGGVPIWIVLALLYQQHEAERKQRLAAEKLDRDNAASAAIFADLTDDLDAARLRLDRLYRYGLPTVSLLVAVFLVSAGGWLLYTHLRNQPTGDELATAAISPACNPVGLMFTLAGIAFAAFISARWLSGYARQRAWQLLRGGASYLMSCFLVSFLLFVGAAIAAIVENTQLFSVLATVIPAVMILIGVEIFLTSLLESYRPKVPGEIPRPAFDSRVLGLLTAPESLGKVVADTISYQFGVEVSGSWLYQLLSRSLTPLTLFGMAFLFAMSSLAIVAPDERGLRLRGGQMVGEPLSPGVHVKLPWPLETVDMHPVGRVQQIMVSTDLTGRSQKSPAVLWTSADDSDSQLGQENFIAAPPADDNGGLSLVSADVIVQYRVGDLTKFSMAAVEHDRLLKLVAQREASRYFATHDIDELLRKGRTNGGPALQAAIQTEADRMGLGIELVAVAVTSLHPPIGEVSRAFHSQIAAVQQRETSIQQARKNATTKLAAVAGSAALANRIDEAIRQVDKIRPSGDAKALVDAEAKIDALLAEAKGEAAEVVHRARAYRWTRAVGERANSERFSGELLSYMASPSYYRTRRFLEVLAEGLAPRRKFVIAGDAGDAPVFRMDFSDPAAAIDSLLTE
jgi:regulator of protease activity HflC (stomatin/prohibitin superfamily)/divalent metal cation (Fe/Co/Zn/Cd) transporter